MKWIKISVTNFAELKIGDRVTKENNAELTNVINEEPVADDDIENALVYVIKDASTSPEKTVQLECMGTSRSRIEITDDELIKEWWRLVQ